MVPTPSSAHSGSIFPFLLAREQVCSGSASTRTVPSRTGACRCSALLNSHAWHRRGSEVTHFAGLDDVVQRLEGFLDGGRVVHPVDLVKVDIVGAEAAQAEVDPRS